ncbi:MAG: peptide chain release factor N(5)-glutamine methyltransferase [Victivallales bacterium]|nr:peptide chain release factor N(5)-glutamine methyltransferase [Victivallales bacterium]
MACERPDIQITATDISPAALVYAERNRQRYKLEHRVRLVKSDLFEGLEPQRFDVISANPPYVTTAEYEALDGEVRDFEPELALCSGCDGLELVRKLITATPGYLVPRGRIYLELGWKQAPAVIALLTAAGFTGGEIRRDLAGRDRFVTAVNALPPATATTD